MGEGAARRARTHQPERSACSRVDRAPTSVRHMSRAVNEIEVTLDRSSPVPLYYQLERELERAIADGRLAKGTFLGNEIELSVIWQLSRPTVRRAIQALVENGLLVRQRGVGTQVVNDELRQRVRLRGLNDELLEQGKKPSTTVLSHEVVVGDSWITDALGIPRGSRVVQIERCRYADGQRLAILRNWLNPLAAGDITTDQLGEQGLYALLRARGVWPHFLIQRIGSRCASPTDAALLGLPVGAPLLTSFRHMQDKSGARVDIGDHVYDASIHSVEMAVVET
jgi:DNA-binding GntR family transcriptional regulator